MKKFSRRICEVRNVSCGLAVMAAISACGSSSKSSNLESAAAVMPKDHINYTGTPLPISYPFHANGILVEPSTEHTPLGRKCSVSIEETTNPKGLVATMVDEASPSVSLKIPFPDDRTLFQDYRLDASHSTSFGSFVRWENQYDITPEQQKQATQILRDQSLKKLPHDLELSVIGMLMGWGLHLGDFKEDALKVFQKAKNCKIWNNLTWNFERDGTWVFNGNSDPSCSDGVFLPGNPSMHCLITPPR